MQKKIIALAVAGLMSGAAFAQSNVTISGNIDLGYQNNKTQTAAAGTDRQQQWGGNGSSTSTIVFAGTEDLGGGMKAGFLLASDYTAGAQQVQTTNTTVASATNPVTANQMFNSQNYLTLSGAFGDVKAGTVNNASLGVSSTSQPFGTAIGSGYSGTFGRLAGLGNAGNAAAAVTANGGVGARLVRSSQSVVYTTPTMSGFSGSLAHVFKNDNDQYGSFGQQELGLKYSGGGLNVAYAYTKMSGTDATAPATALDGRSAVKHNMLGANYKFGPATVYAGYTTSKGGNTAAADLANDRSVNVALKYDVTGNIAVMANVLRANDKLVGNQDRKLTGLGLDYGMSKRTTAYARYETGDNDKTAGNAGKFTRFAAGLRHSF